MRTLCKWSVLAVAISGGCTSDDAGAALTVSSYDSKTDSIADFTLHFNYSTGRYREILPPFSLPDVFDDGPTAYRAKVDVQGTDVYVDTTEFTFGGGLGTASTVGVHSVSAGSAMSMMFYYRPKDSDAEWELFKYDRGDGRVTPLFEAVYMDPGTKAVTVAPPAEGHCHIKRPERVAYDGPELGTYEWRDSVEFKFVAVPTWNFCDFSSRTYQYQYVIYRN